MSPHGCCAVWCCVLAVSFLKDVGKTIGDAVDSQTKNVLPAGSWGEGGSNAAGKVDETTKDVLPPGSWGKGAENAPVIGDTMKDVHKAADIINGPGK